MMVFLCCTHNTAGTGSELSVLASSGRCDPAILARGAVSRGNRDPPEDRKTSQTRQWGNSPSHKST